MRGPREAGRTGGSGASRAGSEARDDREDPHGPTTDPDEISALQNELADLARLIARLVLQPEHEPADLLALDERAGQLRTRIAEARAQERRARESLDLSCWTPYPYARPLLSGG